jgi:hypothetical protein
MSAGYLAGGLRYSKNLRHHLLWKVFSIARKSVFSASQLTFCPDIALILFNDHAAALSGTSDGIRKANYRPSVRS